MIGTKFYKPIQPAQIEKEIERMDAEGKPYIETVMVDNDAPNTDAKYAEAAHWCNETQKATIEDMGDWYEVVAIPEPTEEEQAEAAMTQAKAERAEAVSAITVEVDGMTFDGDETAQDRMARAITMFQANSLPADYTTAWVLADNTVAEVTVAQLSQALLLAGQAQTALWTKPYEVPDDETSTVDKVADTSGFSVDGGE